MTPSPNRTSARIELAALIAGVCLMTVAQHFDIGADEAVPYRLMQMLWVGIEGAGLGLEGLAKIATPNNDALESLTWYVPEFSPLWDPFIEHRHGARDLSVVAYCAIVSCLALPLLRRLGRRLSASIGRGTAFVAQRSA